MRTRSARLEPRVHARRQNYSLQSFHSDCAGDLRRQPSDSWTVLLHWSATRQPAASVRCFLCTCQPQLQLTPNQPRGHRSKSRERGLNPGLSSETRQLAESSNAVTGNCASRKAQSQLTKKEGERWSMMGGARDAVKKASVQHAATGVASIDLLSFLQSWS